MITRNERISVVVGSLILGLLKTMDIQQQIKGSTINFAVLLRTKIYKLKATQKERLEMAETARESMLMLVEQFAGEKENIMQVATFVESLSFSFEKELVEFYGTDFLQRMIRFCEKQVVVSSLAKDSYLLSDRLKENIRKITFEKLKECA